MKIIISGGGTGGHIFPAIAIANSLKALQNVEILFVGANGRMEMEKVPQAGFVIKGLNIAGIQRSFSFSSIKKNLLFPFKLISSLLEAKKIVKDFKPNIVVGVGGYASGPVLWAAQNQGIPTLIQEQNSFAGITNKLLARRASKICVAYQGMEKYFPKEKIIITGNPVRKDILETEFVKLAGCVHFKLNPELKTILVIGGSLGAKTINEAIENDTEKLKKSGVQLIWQTGKNFNTSIQNPKFNILPFIKEMHWAYACADVVISRAGALSISELALVGKPAILVPSPNVSEDHQTKNALALVEINAAIMVKDSDAKAHLVDTVLTLLTNIDQCNMLKNNILQMGKPQAAEQIAKEIFDLTL
ncbi:MAG: undecaprenyldiphospho-muramoylpentapeptide beta-N-acetylglucosaminyltransferase [Bacteroidetes bacterium]|nr:MAG: undecaprenyldiphospho-muramoylpentapeptide beta-N-acetylglucosaminyltransferase [Bacteroidota bacterium]